MGTVNIAESASEVDAHGAGTLPVDDVADRGRMNAFGKSGARRSIGSNADLDTTEVNESAETDARSVYHERQSAIGDWGVAGSIASTAKPIEIIDLGVIEGSDAKTHEFPVLLKDANVAIEGTQWVKVLEMEESFDGFSLITVAADASSAADVAFALIVVTSDRILRGEGRATNVKPAKLSDFMTEEKESTAAFTITVEPDGCETPSRFR
jgi:hypothetical protein